MFNTKTFGILALAWLALASVLWMVAVPSVFSAATLALIAVLGFGGLAGLVMVQRWHEPTRSMAEMLYDTDHPATGKP